jgi:hypothetical protein
MGQRKSRILLALFCFSIAGVGEATSGAMPRWAPPASMESIADVIACSRGQQRACLNQAKKGCDVWGAGAVGRRCTTVKNDSCLAYCRG